MRTYYSLQDIPSTGIVDGDLDLRGTGITELPDDILEIEGSCYLGGCSNLTKLPRGLKVKYYLGLAACTSLTELPDDLWVGLDLNLSHTSITKLPKNLWLGRNLNLAGSAITELPTGLVIFGSVDLGECSSLTKLPDGFKVRGDLYLGGSSVSELPENLEVGQYLNTSNTPITRLPKGLVVGALICVHCHSLTELPDDLKIDGFLDLEDCSNLTKLPENLKLDGYLNLKDCSRLTHLPKGLKVRGYVYLGGTAMARDIQEEIKKDIFKMLRTGAFKGLALFLVIEGLARIVATGAHHVILMLVCMGLLAVDSFFKKCLKSYNKRISDDFKCEGITFRRD